MGIRSFFFKQISYNSFLDLLKDHEFNLIGIKNRLFILKAFQAELSKQAPNQTFKILDDTVNILRKDTFNMLVVDLCSLTEGMTMKNGFFDQIIKNFTPDINSNLKKTTLLIASPTTEQDYRDNYYAQQSRREFEDLFATNSYLITKKNINELSKEFKRLSKPLIDDRNEYRAHRYEKNKPRKKLPSSLNLDLIESQCNRIEEVFNSFRLIYNNSSFYYEREVLWRNSQSSAEDLVDILLNGGIKRTLLNFGIEDPDDPTVKVSKKYYSQARLEYYKEQQELYKLRLDFLKILKNRKI